MGKAAICTLASRAGAVPASASPLPTQSLLISCGKVEDGSPAWVFAPTLETWKNPLTPDFGLAQLQLGHLGNEPVD